MSPRPLVKPKEEERKPIRLDRETLKVQAILVRIKEAIIKGEEIPEKSLSYAKQKAIQLRNVLPEAEEILQLIREKELLERVRR